MKTSDFQDLKVWHKAMDMAVDMYAFVKTLPKEEIFGLGDQIRRCPVSIPSNIAEGHNRNSTKDYIRFLSISRGSLAELLTQLILCKRIGDLLEHDFSKIYVRLVEIDKMLTALINSLNSHIR
ncbi:MAG: four helix bundle protein [Muribaculaceae bacterium]|nr:four helix bundle protein [Muribaculaceae bacterium]